MLLMNLVLATMFASEAYFGPPARQISPADVMAIMNQQWEFQQRQRRAQQFLDDRTELREKTAAAQEFVDAWHCVCRGIQQWPGAPS